MGFNDEENEKKEKKFSKSDALKKGWKMLPTTVKLAIIGGIASAICSLILVSLILSAVPSNFLNYSNEAQTSDDISKEYEEYWGDFCGEDSNCSESQKAAAEELKKSQESFFKKLDKLANKYDVTEEQKYIVLTTIFYNYSIDEFMEGNGAFMVDDTDEIDYDDVETSGSNENGTIIYKQEVDTLKELIKQFKVSTPYCQGYDIGEDGQKVARDPHPLYNASSNNDYFVLNFYEKVLLAFGSTSKVEGLTEAKAKCREEENGTVFTKETSNSPVSIDAYYKYLKTSNFLDSRPQNKEEFGSYGKAHNMPGDLNAWPEEDLIVVRERIIENIKQIVAEHVQEYGLKYVASKGGGTTYWWPIGSRETTPGENGILFAKGEPESIHITSPYGYREHPTSKVKKFHDGVDISGTAGQTNIIASINGEVVATHDGCVSISNTNNEAHLSCGGGYGNFVKIQDTRGNITIYAHLYRDSITVEVGDKVLQGQVIGKLGSSGRSTGPHLHFSLFINGSSVDPTAYADPTDPRPAEEFDFFSTPYSKEEFIAKVHEWYTEKASCSSSGCQNMKNDVLNRNAAETAYDVATSMNLNPEIIFVRSHLEGYSPGTNHNYTGFKCYNTDPQCSSYGSFRDAATAYYKNISAYESLYDMMYKYAFIGYYWYPGGSASGGCYYMNLIYPDGAPERVRTACAKSCSGSSCDPTTAEDQDAYTQYNVKKMIIQRRAMFG